jgi:AcrR family transcriptional regulator
MNQEFVYCERMVHALLDPTEVLRLQQQGLVTPTFRRLDPERQGALALAVLEEALTRGPARVRIKAVAATAGVSVGSLYQYFGSRDGVLAFAIELVARRLSADLAGYIPVLAALPLRDGLTAWVTGGIEWTREQAAVMGFFVRGAYEGDEALAARLVEPVALVMVDAIRAMLAAAIERGEARADLDLDAGARAVHVLLAGVTDAHLLPHLGRYFRVVDVGFDRALAAAVDLAVQGVRP